MKKKILSTMLAMVMVIGLFPSLAPHAHAKEHICADSYYDHYCDVCGEYIPCYDTDIDEDTLCDLCSACLEHMDENGDDRCDICGYCAGEHSFTDYYNEGDENGHYLECDCCPYFDPLAQIPHVYDGDDDYICNVCNYSRCTEHDYVCNGEERYIDSHQMKCIICGDETWDNHYDVNDDGFCDACGSCMNHSDETNYIWDEKTWDSVDHWLACEDCGAGYSWESHFDGNDDGLCDVCDYNVVCPHENSELQYNDDSHYWVCDVCEEILRSPNPHRFDSGYYYQDSDKHYPGCEGCEYYDQSAGEAHVDEDLDEECDICEFWIHEHTYEEGYWDHDDGMHYPVCDLCYEYDRTNGKPCVDKNGDHFCDACYAHMEGLCSDTDGDHICNVCEYPLNELCTDTDGNHICDSASCQRYMKELCFNEDGDWLCDTCEKNFCNHYFMYEPTSNNDGTHTAECMGDCGMYVTEDCYAWHYDASLTNETTHTAFCRCGYKLPTEEHNFIWNSRSVTGHRLVCDSCYIGKDLEAHTAQNGICEICEMQVTDYRDVYVGGVGLKDGQYLAGDGSVSSTKPAGGYAYYKDGVLELNGYVYDGPGFLWIEYDIGEPDWAALYATRDLILVLKGENSLKITRPDAGEYERDYSDGIAAEGNLTIRGDGSLTVQVNDDGVQMEFGDVTIESGTLTVNSEDHGFDVGGSVTVTGGTVNMTAGDDGFNVGEDITISGGEVRINANDLGLDSYGSIAISGGTVNVTAGDDGFNADEDITISGGIITVDAYGNGIYAAEEIIISGGELTATARSKDIVAPIWSDGDIVICGGDLDLTSESEMAIVAYDKITVAHAEVTIETVDMWGELVEVVNGSPLTIEIRHNGTATYIVNADDSTKHDVTYDCCGATVTEGHSFIKGFCACGAADPNYTEPEYTLGDVNGDGTISGKDSNMLKQIITGAYIPDKAQKLAADVNGDGNVNGVDANLISQFIASAITEF